MNGIIVIRFGFVAADVGMFASDHLETRNLTASSSHPEDQSCFP